MNGEQKTGNQGKKTGKEGGGIQGKWHFLGRGSAETQ